MTDPAGLRIRGWGGDADIAGFLALATAVTTADRLPYAWSEASVREDIVEVPETDPSRDVLLAELDGTIVGATWIREAVREGAHQVDHDGLVHPARRGRGIGGALFDAAAARAREIAARVEGDGIPVRLAASLDDTDDAGRALATARGYTEYRWYAQMGRDLRDEPLPAPAPVAGLEIRPLATPERRAAFDALEEAFRDHFGSREWTDEMFGQFFGPLTDETLWRIVWDGDQVVGVSDNGIDERECAELGIRQGWVHTFGVRRAWRGRGVAKWLLAESLAELKRRGCERVSLWVDLDNPTGALGLYESVGFRPLLRSTRWARPLEAPGSAEADR